MIETRRGILTASLAAALTASLLGCEEPPKPAPPPPPSAAWQPPVDRKANTSELLKDLAVYDTQVAQLPGPDGGAHRRSTADLLLTLTRVLRLAVGPDPSPGYADSVAVVSHSAHTIGIAGVPTGRVEAAENEALRATATALDEVAARVLYADAGLRPLLAAVHAGSDLAATSAGPRHDDDATAAFKAVQAALHRIGTDLNETFPTGSPSPTTVDVSAGLTPTTAPAGAAGPTTMP